MLHVLWVFVAFADVEPDRGECGVCDSSDWFSAALCSQVFGDFRRCLVSALLRHMRQKHAALY